jgi:3-isopropylmalate/(R)-2-methylmalate dehydratase small subunit
MKAFTSVTGVAIPFLEDDVNTDQIAPVAGGTRLHENYAETLFRNRRRFDNGAQDPDFVFNTPHFRSGVMLVSGRNFGCGSSRESAVWAFQAIGISCIVARSFADIYRENCLQNGVLPIVLNDADADRLDAAVVAVNGAAPFTVDLVARAITGPGGFHLAFEIPEADRTRLLEGLDDIGLTLKHRAEIEAFEEAIARARPWSQKADASSL